MHLCQAREGDTPAASGTQAELARLSDPAIAAVSQRFFKTGPGEYGEGDRMLGLTLPEVRGVLGQSQLALGGMETLLRSPWHEVRLLGLLLMLGLIQLYPLVRFRAVFGLGFLAKGHWIGIFLGPLLLSAALRPSILPLGRTKRLGLPETWPAMRNVVGVEAQTESLSPSCGAPMLWPISCAAVVSKSTSLTPTPLLLS